MVHNRRGRRQHVDGSGGGGGASGGTGGSGARRSSGQGTVPEYAITVTTSGTGPFRIGKEATDDLLGAPQLPTELLSRARAVLSRENFPGFSTQRQVREFVNSLFVNLSKNQTGDEASSLLTDLASNKGRSRLREILQRVMVTDAGDDSDLTSFQYVMLPLIGVLTRENVCQKVAVYESDLIYEVVYSQRIQFLDKGVIPCMRKLIDDGSMDDTSTMGSILRQNRSLLQVESLQRAMLVIVRLMHQLVKRIQTARKELKDTVATIEGLVADCVKRSNNQDMTYLNRHLENECQDLRRTMSASATPVAVTVTSTTARRHDSQRPNLVSLDLNFDPPGLQSEEGPRHDNDHAQIQDIQIVPTQAELTCERPPFLPSNDVPGALHHLPPGWSRLLDTHFRLNREDMIDQLRKGIVIFLEALHKTTPDNQGGLLNRKRLRQLVGQDVSVNAYGNVEFLGTNVENQYRGSIRVSFDQPPQIKGKPVLQRRIFWERSRRRLIQNSLVCFIYPEEGQGDVGSQDPNNRELRLSLGVIHTRDFAEMAKNAEKAVIHVTMANNTDYCQLVRAVKKKVISPKDVFMVESMGGYFESYRPILQALQTIEPGTMPFGKYLAPTEGQPTSGSFTLVDPPRYALAPGFEFDLGVLLQSRVRCHLNVRDTSSRQRAVAALRTHSLIDDTQSQALVDSLCREVALICGPPGTGKTKIGVDLMRVLIHNAERMKCGPILCICYSDYALDQFLENLLNEGINRLVRIGSRSTERLQQYNLYELVKVQFRTSTERAALNKAYKECDTTAKRLQKVDEDLQSPQPSVVSILNVVVTEKEEQYYDLLHGCCMALIDDQSNAVGDQPTTIEDNYLLWSSCRDLQQIEKENTSRKKKWRNGRAGPSSGPALLPLPNTNRPLNELRHARLWMMSRRERKRLVEFWVDEVEKEIQTRHMELMAGIQSCSKSVNDAFDTIRRGILRRAQVVGVTTYGAAKLQTLIATLQPKIVICEEAGEVLESHILTALSKSTQHLILIGDHLQLRPQISTYELSSESYQGRQYNLDRSLFERLVTSAKVPSSLLTTQRRMRPEICDMIRHTLYPKLIDGEKVLAYPDVSGMATNVFFMSHRHSEDSRDQYLALSACNTFEAKMVKALVQHLVMNGYHQSRIVVLTPYIRQLTKLRDTLRGVTQLAIDERDQEQLDEIEDKDDIALTSGNNQAFNHRLTLRTIDNYQGEEADIIIVSLVRSNSREDEQGRLSTIGFLRSPNRTNVLLSRAKHGMYLIGNADLMNKPQNGIWPQVMTEFGRNNRIGEGFLLRCHNHPHNKIPPATSPEDFMVYMPNGSCEMPCSIPTPCHHICPRMCHLDDPDHQKFMCQRPCARRHPLCGHACSKQCIEDCGDCQLPIGELILRCGHKLKNAFCSQKRNLSWVQCTERVDKRLPRCEHKVEMDCCENVSGIRCKAKCKTTLNCGHSCTRGCHECQSESFKTFQYEALLPDSRINRTVHGICRQRCTTALHCGHICDAPCHLGTDCPPCTKNCEMACSHVKCRHSCLALCSACCEPCAWSCSHQGACKLPCGVPCSRLPCDRRCQETLPCGHQCPSICGEQCPPSKYCVECKSDPSIMEMIVDLFKQTPLSKVDVSEDPILVLPCGHALSASSLDDYMSMRDYYDGDTNETMGTTNFVRTKPLPSSQVPMIGCPSCSAPIVGLRRYGRRIKYAQLAVRLKKFEVVQMTALSQAEITFSDTQSIVQRTLPLFSDRISGLVFTSAQEIIQKNLQVIWQMFSSFTSSSDPSSFSKQNEDTITKSRRTLGSFASDGDFFPNSDISSLFSSYDIPEVQEQIWISLIQPALGALNVFNEVHKQAVRSPARGLFEASAAHLYNFKTRSSVINSSSVKDIGNLMEECARECGLTPDGQAGSSFVLSIQGRANVMLLVLHAAMQVLKKISLRAYHDHPSAIGWSRFVEDLLQCCVVHSRIQCDAAVRGKYPRLEMYAKMNLLDIYFKRMQWLGYRPFDRHNIPRKLNREAAVHNILAMFKRTLQEIQDNNRIDFWLECLPKAHYLEARMEIARKIALGELKRPHSEESKLEIFRTKKTEFREAGHWYHCPNGHPYVIANLEMAMQGSTCPDCDARVGG